uniref:Uncharacterized protein n=1 Tax=Anguilla anguilla TaxID=7936 RepID=A0A0E9V4G5_ANGAN
MTILSVIAVYWVSNASHCSLYCLHDPFSFSCRDGSRHEEGNRESEGHRQVMSISP